MSTAIKIQIDTICNKYDGRILRIQIRIIDITLMHSQLPRWGLMNCMARLQSSLSAAAPPSLLHNRKEITRVNSKQELRNQMANSCDLRNALYLWKLTNRRTTMRGGRTARRRRGHRRETDRYPPQTLEPWALNSPARCNKRPTSPCT